MSVVSPRVVSGALVVAIGVPSWEQSGKNPILLPSLKALAASFLRLNARD
jgi:hypothetical protein